MKNNKDWQVVEDNTTKYVVPISDFREHDLSTVCDCNPRVDFSNGCMIVVHMAFDGRHIIEKIKYKYMNDTMKVYIAGCAAYFAMYGYSGEYKTGDDLTREIDTFILENPIPNTENNQDPNPERSVATDAK